MQGSDYKAVKVDNMFLSLDEVIGEGESLTLLQQWLEENRWKDLPLNVLQWSFYCLVFDHLFLFELLDGNYAPNLANDLFFIRLSIAIVL